MPDISELKWVAFYNDDSSVCEDDNLSFEQVDRSKLKAVGLRDQSNRYILIQHFHPGQRAIFRRRTTMQLGSEEKVVVYLLGWQQTIAGTNVQHISCVDPQQGIIQNTGRWDDASELFYPPQSVPADEQVVGGE